jgi:hypothetical protein
VGRMDRGLEERWVSRAYIDKAAGKAVDKADGWQRGWQEVSGQGVLYNVPSQDQSPDCLDHGTDHTAGHKTTLYGIMGSSEVVMRQKEGVR